jgi:hypothetical protein
VVVSQQAEWFWILNSSESKWLAPTSDQSETPSLCNVSGIYVYRTQFDVGNLDPATANIQGVWLADNIGRSISLNGIEVYQGSGGYTAFSPFTINSGFVSGVNTLDFTIEDFDCPNGIRVEMTGTAQPASGFREVRGTAPSANPL